jgi:hypothetical protein
MILVKNRDVFNQECGVARLQCKKLLLSSSKIDFQLKSL